MAARGGRRRLGDPLVCEETRRDPQLDYFLPGEDLASNLVAGIDVHAAGD
jgi:hypothetical protein